MSGSGYPGDLSELGFLQAYLDSALRKPQAVADAVMRTSVLAGQTERMLLTASLAEQAGEAARRVTHVFEALEDRTYPVARTLSGPLPTVDGWLRFAQLAMTISPASLVARMSIDSSASAYAERLHAFEDVSLVTAAVAAHVSRNPLVLVLGRGAHRPPERFLYAASGGDRHGPVEDDFSLGTGESDAAALADLTADLCWVARGFLGSYVEARAGHHG